MEDSICIANKNYMIKTIIESSILKSYISTQENEQFHIAHAILENNNETYSEEKIMTFHKKALLYLFNKLQKDEKLENNKEYRDVEKKPMKDISTVDKKLKDKFIEYCQNSMPEQIQACFLLKDDNLYHYTISENSYGDISNFIKFIEHNKSIKSLINEWKIVIEVKDSHQVYYEKVNNTDIVVCIVNNDISVGVMAKISKVFINNLSKSYVI